MDMKLLGIMILVICVCLFLGVEWKKRKTFTILLHALNHGEYGEYLTILNSPFVKFVYPKFNRNYMKLNAYLFMEDHEETDHLFQEMLQMKVTIKQRMDLVSKAFHYYIEQGNKEHAAKLMEEIETFDDETLKTESRQIYDIFMLKKFSYIDEMEARLPQSSGMEKGFLEYLLSLQYENSGDKKKSKEYLERSQKDMLPTTPMDS